MPDALLTMRECAAMREEAEGHILRVLRDLTERTGLELNAVRVYLVGEASLTHDDPRRRAAGVRIELGV